MKKENMKTGRSTDFDQETRVLLEDMQSGIKTIAEGHSGIVSRLDRIEARLGTVESELNTVKIVVYNIDSRLINVELRLTKVEHKLDTSIEQNGVRFGQIEKKLALA
ncbi:MAG: hypothetical protein NTY76_00730 [Candidatus Omnitrophica bacterium]|nr:hypothetical protein [Candidatus Omnitrophota bacterium]